VKDTHEIKIAGEEKVAGRDTYKIVAKTKKTDSLFGDIEAWIDKKTWLMLKMKSDNAGNQIITEYSKIIVDEKIDDQQFILDLPEDVTIQEISGEDTSELISLDEAKQQLEKFLMVPQENGLSIDKISMVKGLEDRPEYSFDFGLDGQPAFFITIFKADESMSEIGPILNEKEMDIRGQKGTVMDDKNFRSIAWQENGYQYSIVGENPELTIEDLVSYAQQMEFVQ